VKRLSALTFAAAASAAVAVLIVAALYLNGSPENPQAAQGDERRVRELNTLRDSIAVRHHAGDRLPESLQEFVKTPPFTGLRTTDPETGTPYDYRIVDPDTFELCAVFATSTETRSPGSTADPWRHRSGRFCYTVEVKPSPG
jgi:hypothetical protein